MRRDKRDCPKVIKVTAFSEGVKSMGQSVKGAGSGSTCEWKFLISHNTIIVTRPNPSS